MPKKRTKRNISGLKNQPKQPSHVSYTLPTLSKSHDTPLNEITQPASRIDGSASTDNRDLDENWIPGVKLDSTKPCWDEESDNSDSSDSEDFEETWAKGKEGKDKTNVQDDVKSSTDVDIEDKEWHSKGIQVALMKQAINEGDDPRDESWIPTRLRRKIYTKIGRPKTYSKGPDIGSKAPRTQRQPHYRKHLQVQTNLNGFGFEQTSHTNTGNDSDGPQQIIQPMVIDNDVPLIKEELLASPSPSLLPSSTSGIEDVNNASTVIREETPPPPVLHFDPPIREESMTPPRLLFLGQLDSDKGPETTAGQKRKAISQDVSDDSDSDQSNASTAAEARPPSSEQVELNDSEAASGHTNSLNHSQDSWEEELDEALYPNMTETQDWKALRTQIKNDLKAKHKALSLAQTNQLLILRNFATLMIKKYKKIEASMEIANQWHEKENGSSVYFARRIRALARHYQVFEQLPRERRGGYNNSRSMLKDEAVRNASRAWLNDQSIGSITPTKFRDALNDTILPSLNISLKNGLCERTARRWLVRLGWTRTVLRKGVYMDGHERPDVVQYRSTFLDQMSAHEARMAQYLPNGSLSNALNRVEPKLQPGEREVIAVFQDETCFQANEYKSSAWLKEGQSILMKKGRGRLIHVSDFIEEGNGRLVVRNEEGIITKEARKIIHPGSNGDAWWDCEQLIKQVREEAIPVFEEAHPGCQALFVFDQSSAHAALPPDALRAFEMNKSNGGKQRHQKDTVIPESNPYPEFRGKTQKMTTEDGEAKGLKQTLEERGFDVSKMRAKCAPVCPWENDKCCMARLLSKQDDFVHQVSMLETLIVEAGHLCIFLPKFHCELNPIEMYWGWAKYRYRETPKKTFEDAKQAAYAALNACPVDVIRRFINRSWRFLDAYRIGLTGAAAMWAVNKQKGHRSVSKAAMMHLDAVVDRARG